MATAFWGMQKGKRVLLVKRWKLVDHLRRATVEAGFVAHYEHTCRRCKSRARRGIEGAPPEWRWNFADGEQRTCPTCRMKLWISPVPRPIGFKDLRHSHATILRKQHVDLGTVQKELGHSSSEITARGLRSERTRGRSPSDRARFDLRAPRFAAGAGRVASW